MLMLFEEGVMSRLRALWGNEEAVPMSYTPGMYELSVLLKQEHAVEINPIAYDNVTTEIRHDGTVKVSTPVVIAGVSGRSAYTRREQLRTEDGVRPSTFLVLGREEGEINEPPF